MISLKFFRPGLISTYPNVNWLSAICWPLTSHCMAPQSKVSALSRSTAATRDDHIRLISHGSWLLLRLQANCRDLLNWLSWLRWPWATFQERRTNLDRKAIQVSTQDRQVRRHLTGLIDGLV